MFRCALGFCAEGSPGVCEDAPASPRSSTIRNALIVRICLSFAFPLCLSPFIQASVPTYLSLRTRSWNRQPSDRGLQTWCLLWVLQSGWKAISGHSGVVLGCRVCGPSPTVALVLGYAKTGGQPRWQLKRERHRLSHRSCWFITYTTVAVGPMRHLLLAGLTAHRQLVVLK